MMNWILHKVDIYHCLHYISRLPAVFSSLAFLQSCLILTVRSLLYKLFPYQMSFHLSFLHLYPLIRMITCWVMEYWPWCKMQHCNILHCCGGSLSMMNNGVETLLIRCFVISLVMIMFTNINPHSHWAIQHSIFFNASDKGAMVMDSFVLFPAKYSWNPLTVHGILPKQNLEHTFSTFSSPYLKFSLLASGYFLRFNISKCAKICL